MRFGFIECTCVIVWWVVLNSDQSCVLVPGKNYPETGIKNIYGKTPAIV